MTQEPSNSDASSSRERFAQFRRDWRHRRARGQNQQEQVSSSDDRLFSGKPDWRERTRLRKDRNTRRRYLRRYYAWLRPFWGSLIGLVLVGLLTSTIEVLVPLTSKALIDVITGDAGYLADYPILHAYDGMDLIALLGLGGLLVLMLTRVVNLWRTLALSKVNAQVTHRLRAQLYERILRLPLGDLHDMKSGGIISRLSTDVDGSIGLVQNAVLSPLQALVRLLVVAVVLFMLSWQVTLIALSLLAIVAVIYHSMLRHVRPIYRSMGEDRQRIDGRVAETFGGVRVVRSFARQFREELDYGLGHHTVIRKQLWARGIQSVLLVFWELLMPLTNLAIVVAGCWLILSGNADITIGSLLAIQWMTWQVLQPVFMIVQSMTETQRSLASMERVYEVLEREQEKPDRADAREPPQRVDELRIEGLSFAYGHESPDGHDRDPPEHELVLRDIDLLIPGGSVTALVGPSGAGKTTLVDLLSRFYDPSRGRILLNGVDLRDYRLDSYRRCLGVVEQEVFLFDGSVRENILYARRGASEEELVDAARRANAMEFIERLPGGLDTVIGERGVKLSGGQRQRLSIARAILADPRLLILDEATSNLDTESEQLIQTSTAELLKGRTTFVIAHRLSTIQDADQIVVIEDGRIVQRGRHEELMAAGPGSMYYDMVERQRSRLVVGE